MIPASIRGFGHVKLRSLVEAKRREMALLGRLGLLPVVSRPVREAFAFAETHTGVSA